MLLVDGAPELFQKLSEVNLLVFVMNRVLVGELPVQIHPIDAVTLHQIHHRSDEYFAIGVIQHHLVEPARVPGAPHRHQNLELLVCLLQVDHGFENLQLRVFQIDGVVHDSRERDVNVGAQERVDVFGLQRIEVIAGEVVVTDQFKLVDLAGGFVFDGANVAELGVLGVTVVCFGTLCPQERH